MKENVLPEITVVRSSTLPFPCWFWACSFPFFSVSLKVLSQGNLRRRSPQGPRSATTPRLTYTTPKFLGFFFSLLVNVHFLLTESIRLCNMSGCIQGTFTYRYMSLFNRKFVLKHLVPSCWSTQFYVRTTQNCQNGVSPRMHVLHPPNQIPFYVSKCYHWSKFKFRTPLAEFQFLEYHLSLAV
jgi:hypothetical protein